MSLVGKDSFRKSCTTSRSCSAWVHVVVCGSIFFCTSHHFSRYIPRELFCMCVLSTYVAVSLEAFCQVLLCSANVIWICTSKNYKYDFFFFFSSFNWNNLFFCHFFMQQFLFIKITLGKQAPEKKLWLGKKIWPVLSSRYINENYI